MNLSGIVSTAPNLWECDNETYLKHLEEMVALVPDNMMPHVYRITKEIFSLAKAGKLTENSRIVKSLN